MAFPSFHQILNPDERTAELKGHLLALSATQFCFYLMMWKKSSTASFGDGQIQRRIAILGYANTVNTNLF
jgi:hypothetical protein